MSSSGLVVPAGSPMREGNVTGSVNAPVPAFATPFPSIIGPDQSTVTVRENVAILHSVQLNNITTRGFAPRDSPTRSLAGPREPHSARVGSLARSFATCRYRFETTSNHGSSNRGIANPQPAVHDSRSLLLARRRP